MAKTVIMAPTAQQFDRMKIRVIESRGIGIAGHQDERECLLDVLLADGGLGSDKDTARKRHEAGIWLRTLHTDAGLSVSQTGSYAPATDTGTGDLTPEQETALKLFNRYMRRLGPGPAPRLLQQVCCWDELPRAEATLAFLRYGLDKLVRMRGL